MDLRAGKVKPPYKPVVAGPDDTRNIDTLFLNEKIKETPDQSMTGSEKTKTNFKGFTYHSYPNDRYIRMNIGKICKISEGHIQQRSTYLQLKHYF